MKRIVVYTLNGSCYSWDNDAHNMWNEINPAQIKSVEQIIEYSREEWLKSRWRQHGATPERKVIDGTPDTCEDCRSAIFGQCDWHKRQNQ